MSLLVITLAASFIYYKKIKQVNEEYNESKSIVKSLTKGFVRQVSKLNNSILSLKQEILEVMNISSDAYKLSKEAIEISRENEKERDSLKKRFETTERSIEKIKENLKDLSKKPMYPRAVKSVDAPIPLREDIIFDQITPTELKVLFLIDDMGHSTGPQIKENINKTREHTARLLKKLFELGFIDRNTSGMPYRYSLRKEIIELIQKQKAKSELSL